MGRRRSSAPPITLFSFQDIITSVTGVMLLVTLMMVLELIRRPQQAEATTAPPEPTQDVRQELAEAMRQLDDLKRRQESGAELLKQLAQSPIGQANAKDLKKAVDRLAADLANLDSQKREAERRERETQRKAGQQQIARSEVVELEARARQLAEALDRAKKQNRIVYNPTPGATKAAWLIEISENRLLVARAGQPGQPLIFENAQYLADFHAWVRSRDRQREYFVLLIKPAGIKSFLLVQGELRRQGFDMGFDLVAADQTAVDPLTGAGL